MALLVLFLCGLAMLLVMMVSRWSMGDPDSISQHSRVTQLLYQVEVSAAHNGWTDDLHRQAADLRYQMGDVAGAVAHWEAVQSPDGFVLRQLGQMYIDWERWQDAVNTLARLLELEADDRWAHFQLGTLLAAFHPLRAEAHLRVAARVPEYTDVAAALLNVVLNEPDDPLISLRVGLGLSHHEMWPQAERAFLHAAVIGYPHAEALAYIALARQRQAKQGDAWIEQALALGADMPQVHYVHGLLLRGTGHYAASLSAFTQAMLLDPANPAYYAELSSAHLLLFDYEQAEYWLRQAVAVSGNATQFQELLVVFYANEGYNVSNLSLDTLTEVDSLLPQDPEILADFGWALHTMGDTQAGLEKIEAALRLAPENPAALYQKARILADSGDMEQARSLIQRVAISNSPYAVEANHLLHEWIAQDEPSDEQPESSSSPDVVE